MPILRMGGYPIMKCKFCGKKMKWWERFRILPPDYCSIICNIKDADREAESLRRSILALEDVEE